MTEPSGVTLQAKCGESTKLLKGVGSVVAGAVGEIIASKPLKAVLFDVAGSSDNTDLCCLFFRQNETGQTEFAGWARMGTVRLINNSHNQTSGMHFLVPYS